PTSDSPDQHDPPASTRKKLSMSASVAVSPSLLKSAAPHAAQQFPARHAKNASMSWSVPETVSPSKSAVQRCRHTARSARLLQGTLFAEVKAPPMNSERVPSARFTSASEVTDGNQGAISETGVTQAAPSQ